MIQIFILLLVNNIITTIIEMKGNVNTVIRTVLIEVADKNQKVQRRRVIC